jgi:hypothetical protein
MNNSKKLNQLYTIIDAIQQIQTSSTKNVATPNLKGSLMEHYKKSTDDVIQSQHSPNNQKSKNVHNDRQKEPAPPPDTQNIKDKSHARKLYAFLPQMTSARPFISYQNRQEQINDINTQYIKKVTDNANSKLLSATKNTKPISPHPHSMSDGREWVNSLRAGKKYNNKFAEDLRKAIWYLDKRASMWENDNEL